jgi:RNA recognition motif-containing protein
VPGNCTTIFVKNLPYDCTEDEVGDFFAKFGKIENVRFAIHPVLKHFKGYI